MRFLADMGISPITVSALREQSHDAVHVSDYGMQKSSDREVLEKAREESRILLTADLDFGYLLAVGGMSLPSIILFRLSDMRPGNVTTHILKLIDHYEQELLSGAFAVATESRLRVRRLPIGMESD